MQTTIIAFGYKARQGKDTVVQAIQAERGGRYDIRRYGFADALKREVAGRERALCAEHNIPFDETTEKQSRLLQFYGENRRRSDPFYWIQRVERQVRDEQPQFALISDLRYLNELYWVLSKGGFICKVVRFGFIDPSRDPQHSSETQLDGFDFVGHVRGAEINCLDGEVEQLSRDALCLFDGIVAQVDLTDAVDPSHFVVPEEPQIVTVRDAAMLPRRSTVNL